MKEYDQGLLITELFVKADDCSVGKGWANKVVSVEWIEPWLLVIFGNGVASLAERCVAGRNHDCAAAGVRLRGTATLGLLTDNMSLAAGL